MAFFDTSRIPLQTLTPEPWAIFWCPSHQCQATCQLHCSYLLLLSVYPLTKLALYHKVRALCLWPRSAQMLCEVVRECETISCSCNKFIILGLYERDDFVFTHIKIHFISVDASTFHKHSRLVSIIPQFSALHQVTTLNF